MIRATIATALALCAPAAWSTKIGVTTAGQAYAPAEIMASVGDTLVFVNDDGVAHNLFVPTAGRAPDLGKQDPGAEAQLTLRRAGRFEAECVPHESMLTVVEATR